MSANKDHLLQVDVVEFGDLLTVAKVENDHKFEDIINWNSKKESSFLVEKSIEKLVKGDILQFERKNFYILDSKTVNEQGE